MNFCRRGALSKTFIVNYVVK